MLHIYPMCGIFYLPSIDTGTRNHQFYVSSEQHPVVMNNCEYKISFIYLSFYFLIAAIVTRVTDVKYCSPLKKF